MPLSTLVEAVDQRMREVMPHVRQTVTSSLTVPRPPDPAFVPVVDPPRSVVSDSLRVLGVHGFANQYEGPISLAREWLPVIRDGVRRVDPAAHVSAIDLTIAFFADLLSERRHLGPEAPGDKDEEAHEDLTPAETEMLAGWIAAAEDAQLGRRPRLRTAIQRVAGLVAGGMPSRAVERALMTGLRELSRYFQHENRGAVTARIHRAVADTRPHVLLAHSLGSVAAYDRPCGRRPTRRSTPW